MSNNYKILLGVQLNTKGIASQIKAIKIKTPLRLDVKLNTKGIASQIKAINTKTPIKLNVKIDTKNIAGQIRAISTKTPIRVGVKLDTKGVAGQIRAIGGKTPIRIKTQLDTSKTQSDFNNLKAKLADKIKLKVDDDTLKNSLHKAETEFNKLKNKSNELNEAMKQLRLAKTAVDNAAKTNNTNEIIKSYERYEKALRTVNNQLKINARQERANATDAKLAMDREAFQAKINAWLKNNSAAAKQFGARLKELKAQAQNCDRTTLNHLKNEFKKIDIAASNASKKTLSLADRLKKQFSKYSMYFSTASAIMYATQALRDMFRQVVAIDTAMTELKKVTDETTSTYDKFLTNAASKASELGTTIDGLVSSTADFARLGYGFEDAGKLAEVANIYTVVGDEIDSIDTATQSLISTMKAFKDEAGDVGESDFAIGIVDKMNEVSNNFAISSGGIGEALTRSASSLAAANNDLDQSIALITAANTVVQDPTVVGTALKTISMRVRGAKTEMEELGLDTEGMVESTAKLQKELKALTGVDIMIDKDNFMSTYDMIGAIANKWEELTDIQQASVTELIAGKRQGNIIASLMTNWDIAEDALRTSQESAGSAMREHEKWLESLQAKINQLKAAWQGLSQSFMRSGFLKGFLGSITGLVDGLAKFIDMAGVIPTLLTGFMAFKSFNGKGIFRTVENEAALSGKRITNIFRVSLSEVSQQLNSMSVRTNTSFRNSLVGDVKALSAYRSAINSGVSSTEAFNAHLSKAGENAQAYAQSGRLAAEGMSGFIKEQKSAQIATVAQNKSFSTASALMREYNGGCKNVGMSQKDFVSAVKDGNPAMGRYLSGLNGAKAGMAGYVTSLVGAKVASLALTVATTALNMALTMGVSAAISLVISWMDKAITTSKELSEQVDELTAKYKEQHSELIKHKSDFDTDNAESLANQYAKLSKGVDDLGNNISLTSSEYERYHSVTNEVADLVPSLVAGYDAQGNAILNTKGNVDALVEAYQNLISVQNNKVLSKAGDIQKDFQNTLDKYNDEALFNNPFEFDDMTPAVKDLMLSAMNEDWSTKRIRKEMDKLAEEGTYSATKLRKAFNDAGIIDNKWYEPIDIAKVLKNAIDDNPDEVKSIISNFETTLEEDIQDMKTIADATISQAFDVGNTEYSGMSDSLQSIARYIVSGFDFDYYTDALEKGGNVRDEVNSLLDSFSDLQSSGQGAKIEAIFDLQTRFNNGDIPYGEFINGVNDAYGIIDNLEVSDEIKQQFKLALNTEDIEKDYVTLKKRLTSGEDGFGFTFETKEAEDFLNNLTKEELAVGADIIADLDEDSAIESADELEALIRREMAIRGLTLDLNVTVEAEGLEAVNTALAESVSATGLSAESIKTLKSRYADLEAKGYDLSAMFEETSTGIHINRSAFNELEQAYASQKLDDVNKDLATMENEYNLLTEDISNCTDATKKAELINKQQSLARQINEAATLASQYEGLTSAYNSWINAEEAGQERDMYENIIKGFETMEDELSRGWIDDGSIEFLELLTGKTDLVSKSTKDLKKVYDGLDKKINSAGYSVRDFFTVDDDGNSTNTGVYNFLETVEALEKSSKKSSALDKTFKDIKGIKDLVKRDKDGNIISFDFGIAGGDEAIAEALGISEELVQIMLRAADDAGFVVNMDGTYSQLANMQSQAIAANDKLKELSATNEELKKAGGEHTFDFNTTNVKTIKDDLKVAKNILNTFKDEDGNIDLEADGAEQAMQIVSTLQAKLDNLDSEKYGIGLTVEDEQFQEPLERLQEYGHNIATLNQLEINPNANTAEIEKVNAQLDETAGYFASLDKDTKIAIGLEADDGIKEVKEKISKGEVKIPTVLDIQTKMSQDIEDLKKIALLNSGILSKEEEEAIKLDLVADVNIEVGEVDSSNLEKEVVEEADKAAQKGGKASGKNGNKKGKGESSDRQHTQQKPEKDIKETTKSLKQLRKEYDKTRAANDRYQEKNKTLNLPTKKLKEEKEALDNLKKAYDKQLGGIKGFGGKENSDLREAVVDVAFNYENGNASLSELNAQLDEIENEEVRANVVMELTNSGTFDELLASLSGKNKEIVVEALTKGTGDVEDLNGVIDSLPEESQSEVRALVDDAMTNIEEVNGKLYEIGSSEHTVALLAEVLGVEDLEELEKRLEGLDDKQLQVLAEVLGSVDVEKLKTVIDGLDDKTVQAIAEALGEGDVEGLKTVINGLDDKTVQAIAEALGYEDVDSLKGAIDNLDPKTVEAIAKAFGIKDVDSLKGAIDNLDPKTVEAIAKAIGKSDVKSLKDTISGLKSKTITVTAKIKNIVSTLTQMGKKAAENRTGGVNGTANVDGTAFKQGSWGTKNSGTALVGELGTEVLVRNGKYYTIGDNGAEFIKYKRGDIIFNHVQSEELFRNGKVTSGGGRAKALVGGTAFAEGTAFSSGTGGGWGKVDGKAVEVKADTVNVTSKSTSTKDKSSNSSKKSTTKKSSSKKSSTKKSSSSTDDFEETFDWIEIKISRVERAVDRLDTVASRTWDSWSNRNTNLSKEITQINTEISTLTKASSKYKAAANNVKYKNSNGKYVKLSDSWKKKVRNGTIDFSTITNENLANAIKEYQEWYFIMPTYLVINM